MPAMSTYLATYRLGDYVDIVANGAIHKGMPYRFYHGKTGRVWNVTKSAVGVMVNKRVGGRIIAKRIHVRIEHVQQSRCIQEFKARVKANEKAKAEAKRTGSETPLKKSHQPSHKHTHGSQHFLLLLLSGIGPRCIGTEWRRWFRWRATPLDGRKRAAGLTDMCRGSSRVRTCSSSSSSA